jgi:hypothetical protein
MSSKKQRKQWKLNAPVPLGGRVSYPLGDERRQHQHGDREAVIAPPVEWTMRPDGNNFALRSRNAVASKNKATFKTTQSQSISRTPESTVSLSDFVQKQQSITFVEKQAVEQSYEETQDTLPQSTVRLMRTLDLSKSDILSLGKEVWIPCKYNLDDNSLVWHDQSKLSRTCLSAYFNVVNWTVVLNRTIHELSLTKRLASSTFPSHQRTKEWTVCYMNRHRPEEVYWQPDACLHDEEIVPFFVSNHSNRDSSAEEVVWHIPEEDERQCRMCIQTCNGEVISCGFVYKTSINSSCGSVPDAHVDHETPLTSGQRKPGAEREIGSGSVCKPRGQSPAGGAGDVPVAVETLQRRGEPLPLPSCSGRSSSPLHPLHLGSHGERECVGESEGGRGVIGGDAYFMLTHLHSCDDMIALDWAVHSSIDTRLKETLECVSERKVGMLHLRRQAEWSEIVSRDNFMLLKELCHVMMYTNCQTDPQEQEQKEIGRQRAAASQCLLAVAHLCPEVVRTFLSPAFPCPPPSQERQEEYAAEGVVAACVCCGCSLTCRGGAGGLQPSHLTPVTRGSRRNEYILKHFVSPLVALLEEVLDNTSCLISDYVKLHFSSPSSSNHARAEDTEIVFRQTNLANKLEMLTTKSSLLLLVLTSSQFVLNSHNATTPCSHDSYCGRCSQWCKSLEHTTTDVGNCDNENHSGHNFTGDDDSRIGGEYLLVVLQWALEISMKTVELPCPLPCVRNGLSRSVYATLDEVSRVLCVACTPLYSAMLQWLPSRSKSPQLPRDLDISDGGSVLANFMTENHGSSGVGDNMQQFGAVMIDSLCRSICIVVDVFQGGRSNVQPQEVAAAQPEAEAAYKKDDSDVVLSGPEMFAMLLSVSSLVGVLQLPIKSCAQPAPLSDQTGWEIIRKSLQFLSRVHSVEFFTSFAFPSLTPLISTLMSTLELLDTLLFALSWMDKQAGVMSPEEAREEVLQVLEGCLEAAEECQARAGAVLMLQGGDDHEATWRSLGVPAWSRSSTSCSSSSSSSFTAAAAAAAAAATGDLEVCLSEHEHEHESEPAATLFASLPSGGCTTSGTSWSSEEKRAGRGGRGGPILWNSSSSSSSGDRSSAPLPPLPRSLDEKWHEYSSNLIKLLSKCYY